MFLLQENEQSLYEKKIHIKCYLKSSCKLFNNNLTRQKYSFEY